MVGLLMLLFTCFDVMMPFYIILFQRMDNKQDDLNIQEEILEVECEERQEMEAEDEENEESEVDQLLPQPAFHIEEDHQNLTQEERDAFIYIMSVRSQKQAILKSQPKTIQNGLLIPPQEILASHAIHLNQNTSEQSFEILREWTNESVTNWRLVVQNLKYLQKTTLKEKYFKEKLNTGAMSLIPEAYKLCLNTSLNLSRIQRCLVQFSNAYYERVENLLGGHESTTECHFHLWIYSLLALHQSYASYTNFQALASINAVIEKEAEWFLHEMKSHDQANSNRSSNQFIKWLINLVVLIEVFNQKFLKKHIFLANKLGLI